MTINAKELTPGQAIEYSYILAKGMLDLADQGVKGANLSIYYEGEPGVGKSSVVRAVARLLNYKLVDRRANTMNPDDAIGTRMQDLDTRKTEWFAPEWLPNEDGGVDGLNEFGEPFEGTLIFLDELASADDRVRKPLFSIFLDKEANGRKLPKNCIVMAAGNESETGTMVFELDNATRSRFITSRIIADFKSWSEDYAGQADITPTVISYLKQNLGRFCETERALESGTGLYGNPRSWENVSTIERSIMRKPGDRKDKARREALEAMVAGKVGVEIAGEFMGVFDQVSQMANLFDLLQASKGARKDLWPKSIGQLHALSYSMMSYPISVPMAQEILDLMEEFPTESELPFQEMKTPIHEVMLKKLTKMNGISKKELDAAFAKGSKATTDEILKNGPLIDLRGKIAA